MYNPSATFTREELYAAVWSEPRTRLARKYGISDSGLTKICRRYRIPVPEPGHWQRLAAGKRTVQPPLPELTEEDLRYGLGAPIKICASPGSPARPESAEVEAAVARLGLNDAIAVDLRLSDPSPIVERTAKRLGCAKANERGLLETDAPGAVTIAVSPDSIDRALRIADAFVRAGQASGIISTNSGPSADASMRVNGEVVPWSIRELMRREDQTEPPLVHRQGEEKSISDG